MTPIVYLDRMEAGIRSTIMTILGVSGAAVLWAPTEYPRELQPATAVSLSVIGGPTNIDSQARRSPELHATSGTLTLSGAAGRVYIGCSGAQWWYDVASGEDVSDARDAVIVLLEELGHRVYATVAPSGLDAITLVADDAWSLYGMVVSGPVTLVEDVTVFAQPTTSDVIVRVGVQVFSSSRYPSTGALASLSAILGSLPRASSCEALGQYGIAISGTHTPPVDLSGIAGASWESRAAANIDIRMTSYAADALDTIDSVAATIIQRGAEGSENQVTTGVVTP